MLENFRKCMSEKQLWFKELILMKKIIIILAIFFFDRVTKIYLINLQTEGTNIDFYIYPFLNF